MNVPIELLVIGIIFSILLIWSLWFNITKKFYSWRYKEKNDKGRQQNYRRRSEPVEDATISIPRPSQLEVGGILPTTESSSVGKDSNRNRKIKFLGRFRRK